MHRSIFSTFTTLSALFATAVNAHMAIQVPQPIPGSDSKSPLDPSGSNFPCQGADLSGGSVTQMSAGSSQPLQFNLGQGANTAVHGGGSCQISLGYSTDAASLKNPSNWKVIHSFVGGCPTEAMGNLDTAVPCSSTAGTACVNQNFTFTVPSEVQNGNAILAWTWFNNVGNREMYMNCAKVSISGGSNQMNNLPALFTANIGNGCATTEDFNTDFPNPGQYVTKSNLNYPLKAPTGTCQTGSGSANAPTSPQSKPSSVSTAPQTTASGSGTFAENPAPAQASTMATVAASPPAAASAPAVPPATPQVANGACSSSQVSCSASGFYCISATQFGQCAYGCATPMAVAAGTSCVNDKIQFATKKRFVDVLQVRKRNIFGRSL